MHQSTALSVLLALMVLLTTQSVAAVEEPADTLSAAAERGKASVGVCLSCHNPELDPPLGPPLFGVQKRYRMMYPDKPEFVQRMISFVKEPQLEKAIMRRPVRKLGLMPAMNLPEEQLSDIAHYIYEASFGYPCRHWEIAVKNAEEKGQVDLHIQKDKTMLKRFCQ